jgi:drug/metabolite transporter, DME family
MLKRINAMPGHTSLKALLLTALAPILWSTGGIGIRLVDVSAGTILFYRSLFMTLALSGWILYNSRKKSGSTVKTQLRHSIPVAFFFALSLIFYIYSVQKTSVADSLLLQGTAPIFIVLLGWIVLHEKLRKVTVVALVMVLSGIAVIMLQSLKTGGLSGNLLGLIKALAFASGTIVIRADKSAGLLPATTFAAFLSMLFALTLGPSFRIDLYTLAVLAYLGIFQVGIGYIFFVRWSGSLSSSQTGLLVILEAVLGPVWPWIFLGERPFPLTFVGGGIIIAALVMHTLMYQRKKTS